MVFTSSAIAGKGISYIIDRTLGLGYALGSSILIILLLWYKKEKAISVEYITTTSAEIYYWIAFLIANTLGTAAGDFVADSLGVGFFLSAIMITGLLIIIIILQFYNKISKIILFWIAFALTRPFGATFGYLLTKPIEKGGLDLGTIGASMFLIILLTMGLLKETKLEKART